MKRKHEYKEYRLENKVNIQDEIDDLNNNPGLRKLDLSKNNLTAEELTELAEAIIKHPGLIEIDLTDNLNFGSDGIKVLATILRDSPRLTGINLARNSVYNEGIEYLTEALTSHPNLMKLNLRNNHLGGTNANLLAEALVKHSKLVELDMSDTFIDNKFIEILTAIPSLTNLNISGVRLVTDKGFQALARMHNLKQLNISSNRWKPFKYAPKGEGCQEFVARLAEVLTANPELETLDISNNQINDEEAKQIAKILIDHPSLKKLDISSNDIKDIETIKEFANLNLVKLDLSNLHIDKKLVAEAIASASILALISKLDKLEVFEAYEESKLMESVIASMNKLTIDKNAPDMDRELKENAIIDSLKKMTISDDDDSMIIDSLEKIKRSDDSLKDKITKIGSFLSKEGFFAPEKESKQPQDTAHSNLSHLSFQIKK